MATTVVEKTVSHDHKVEPAGSSDASTGSGYVEEANIGDSEWTVAEETAVRRKFDLTITPLVTLLCKSAISPTTREDPI